MSFEIHLLELNVIDLCLEIQNERKGTVDYTIQLYRYEIGMYVSSNEILDKIVTIQNIQLQINQSD